MTLFNLYISFTIFIYILKIIFIPNVTRLTDVQEQNIVALLVVVCHPVSISITCGTIGKQNLQQ